MPLPQPTYPPVRPTGFSSAEQQVTRAAELYIKYHPAAMQQRMYQSILEEESWKAQTAVAKMQILSEERTRVLNNVARLREAELRSAGRTSRSGGGAGGGGGSGKDVALELAKESIKRQTNIDKHGRETEDLIEKKFQLTPDALMFINAVKNDFAPGPGGTSTSLPNQTTLNQSIEQHFGTFLSSRGAFEVNLDDPEVASLIAGRLYTALRSLPVDTFNKLDKLVASGSPPVRQDSAPGMNVAAVIDSRIPANHYVKNILASGSTPDADVESKKEAIRQSSTSALADPIQDPGELWRKYQALTGAGPGPWAAGPGGGATTPGAQTDDPEALFMSRLAELDSEIAALQDRESPATLAARRTLGWEGGVSPEAFAAASAVNPIAGESLAGALGRVHRAGGKVEPETDVEKFAQELINTGGERDFNGFMQQVIKKYPNDLAARRQAAEYFGAFYYVFDTRGQTLNPGVLEAAPEAVQGKPAVDLGSSRVATPSQLDPAEEFLRQVQALPAEVDLAQAHTSQQGVEERMTLAPGGSTLEVVGDFAPMTGQELSAAVLQALDIPGEAQSSEVLEALRTANQYSSVEAMLADVFPNSPNPQYPGTLPGG